MKEATRKKIVYCLFVVGLIWGGYNLVDRREPLSDTDEAGRIDAIPSHMSAETPQSRAELGEGFRDTGWGEDPFRPRVLNARRAVPTEETPPQWTLSGIVYSGDSPMAVINGRAVREGDSIDGAQVVRVERRNVILDHEGRRITLTVSKG